MPFSTPIDGFVPAVGITPGTSFYNALRDAIPAPLVPTIINQTTSLVTDFLTQNRAAADTAIATANETITALATPVLPEDLPPPPPLPNILTTFASAVAPAFDTEPNLGTLTTGTPDTFYATPITIPSIEDEIPEYTTLGLVPIIPSPPTLVLPTEPTEPDIDYTFDLPTAPTADYGGAPDLVEFVMPELAPITVPSFDDAVPVFDVLPPDPRLQWDEPVYASDMKDAVAAVIQSMLAGGTGLTPDVELATWEKGRVREDITARKAVQEVEQQWTAKGFSTPGGPIDRAVRAAIEEAARRGNELSREVMLKQADLEQSNRQFAVEKALSYEQIFVGVFLAIVDRNFQIAKFAVETEIQVYNLQVTAFNVERQVFEANIARFRVRLEATFALLKEFEARVEAEKAKGAVNLARVQVYSEKVKAFNAQVEAFSALVKAAAAKADLQKNKVEVYKGQIDAMVAKINGQKSKFDAYDSQVKGEVSKIQLEQTNAQVYGEQVRAIGTKADILIKQAQIGLETNDQTLKWNIANMQRITARNGQELDVVQARLAAYQASTARGSARYSSDLAGKQAELTANVELAKLGIARYQALLEQWKTRSQEIIAFAQITSESLRAAGTMASNLAAGAMAAGHVSAGLSASASAGKTQAESANSSTSQTQNVSETNSYAIAHNYNHRT